MMVIPAGAQSIAQREDWNVVERTISAGNRCIRTARRRQSADDTGGDEGGDGRRVERCRVGRCAHHQFEGVE